MEVSQGVHRVVWMASDSCEVHQGSWCVPDVSGSSRRAGLLHVSDATGSLCHEVLTTAVTPPWCYGATRRHDGQCMGGSRGLGGGGGWQQQVHHTNGLTLVSLVHNLILWSSSLPQSRIVH